MDANKNSYTFLFAFLMVVVVAAVLSFAATSLKPMQEENERLEKMQSILASINVKLDRDQSGEAYRDYVKEELVLQEGKPVEDVNAFKVELSKELPKKPEQRQAPLYVAEKDGETYYVVPLRGKGLWGPIWGYISLKEDGSTVYGATFDHKGETPGLGAEISTSNFMDQFQGKQIMDDGTFTGIRVTKKDAKGEHEVDGISGGTITSDGVQAMIQDCMKSYLDYLQNQANAKGMAQASAEKENETAS